MGSYSDDSEMSRCKEVLLDESRGPLTFNTRKILRHPVRFMQAASFIMTAHHPPCDYYYDHVFTMRDRRWCIGCFFNTLSFIIGMITFTILWILQPDILNRFYMFWGGIGVVFLSFLLSVTGLTDRRKIKFFSKFLLGSAFASVVWSILIAGESISYGLGGKLFFIFFLYSVVMIFLSAKHIIEYNTTCRDCEYKMRWSRCPGFGENLCELINEGFLLSEKKDEDHHIETT